ncbi:MAG: metal-dependent hydrolase [Gallionellales bacterium RIFCSPLOWO2_12_FULL_59_22]|nr:MAG: metal-dependent hydrolase [Gallionellales bacterium RIFCSPLOWO2_02_FULL_59_110]OGT02529.1 MAG: metal-dependent hydrolase [Gallionellales bacterium RIFCSPLOWO2_02_58_13]OGT14803.1 MAG: metal-dependent hydrolase [Gallionellales bacterium RIFCSPLOWO2_12_FULL_59_22]
MAEIDGLEHWVAVLSRADLPVMKHTARDLAALCEDDRRLNPSSIAVIVARDPIMTVKLLRYLQRHKHKAQTAEVVQIEQALLMMGVEAFFNKVPPEPLLEEVLQSHAPALPPALRVVHRSLRASEYAKDWAVLLRDLHYEEVRIAALLHDIAEILMWCFAPEPMLEIHRIKQQNKALRSRDVQQQVLGFMLFDLQREIAAQWGLPQLLLTLMNDSCSNQPRVRNVELAANLARHSANGWDDAALPDDFNEIAELLRIPAEEVMIMLEADAGIVCDLSKPH